MDTVEGLNAKGIQTQDALRFIVSTPQTYLIQVNFNAMLNGKLPLLDIFKAIKSLNSSL